MAVSKKINKTYFGIMSIVESNVTTINVGDLLVTLFYITVSSLFHMYISPGCFLPSQESRG